MQYTLALVLIIKIRRGAFIRKTLFYTHPKRSAKTSNFVKKWEVRYLNA